MLYRALQRSGASMRVPNVCFVRKPQHDSCNEPGARFEADAADDDDASGDSDDDDDHGADKTENHLKD